MGRRQDMIDNDFVFSFDPKLLAALRAPEFLLVRIDARFNGRYARVIHRSQTSPSGRTSVYEDETATIQAALDSIGKGHEYAVGHEY
jgi:hypothetical protein